MLNATGKLIPAGGAKIGDTVYATLDEAMEAVSEGDTATIYLGEGIYSGNSVNPTEQGKGAGKNLTFVGAGTGETTWQIQAAKQYDSDGWCDYSFKGSDCITFENMTVVGSVYPDRSTKSNNRDEQNRRKEQPANTVNGNQKSFGHLKGAKTIAR